MFQHYTMNQVILPLDLEMKLQENDIAYTINELVESIPEEAFEGFLRQTGRPAYHPRMMMKIILCLYPICFLWPKDRSFVKRQCANDVASARVRTDLSHD